MPEPIRLGQRSGKLARQAALVRTLGCGDHHFALVPPSESDIRRTTDMWQCPCGVAIVCRKGFLP